MYWEQRPKDAQPFRQSQYMPGFLYLENYLISSLNNNCKRKETPEYGYLDTSRLCSLILNRAGGGGAGLTVLHRAQLFRNGFDIGHCLGGTFCAVPNTCYQEGAPSPGTRDGACVCDYCYCHYNEKRHLFYEMVPTQHLKRGLST